MIPAGRTPIDRAGIGALHGYTSRQAARYRPWAAPDHPDPLTTGRPTNGRRQLWDAAQATAYARGRAIQKLPDGEHSDDLLDLYEAAAFIGVNAQAWRQDRYRGLIPDVDATPYGVLHWRRATLLDYRRRRQRPRQPAGGRPPQAIDRIPRGTARKRIAKLLARKGDSLSIAEIARVVGVSYSTAFRHATEIRRNES